MTFLLKAYREAHLPQSDKLPLIIRGKIYFIEKLFDKATLFLSISQAFPDGLPNFESNLEILISIKDKVVQEKANNYPLSDSEAEVEPIFIYNPDNPDLMLMGSTEYEPGNDLSDLISSLIEIWSYWVNWPYSRVETITENDSEIDKAEKVKVFPFTNIEATLDLSLVKIAYQVGVETAKICNWAEDEEKIYRLISEASPEIKEAYEAIMQEGGGWSNRPGGAEQRQKAVLTWFNRNEPRLSYLKKSYLEATNFYNDGGGQEKRNFEGRLLIKIIEEEAKNKLTFQEIKQKCIRLKR